MEHDHPIPVSIAHVLIRLRLFSLFCVAYIEQKPLCFMVRETADGLQLLFKNFLWSICHMSWLRRPHPQLRYLIYQHLYFESYTWTEIGSPPSSYILQITRPFRLTYFVSLSDPVIHYLQVALFYLILPENCIANLESVLNSSLIESAR